MLNFGITNNNDVEWRTSEIRITFWKLLFELYQADDKVYNIIWKASKSDTRKSNQVKMLLHLTNLSSIRQTWTCCIVITSIHNQFQTFPRSHSPPQLENSWIGKGFPTLKIPLNLESKHRERNEVLEIYIFFLNFFNLPGMTVGLIAKKLTQAAPVPWPTRVTFPGSPPKSSMCCWTQCNAAIWSMRP